MRCGQVDPLRCVRGDMITYRKTMCGTDQDLALIDAHPQHIVRQEAVARIDLGNDALIRDQAQAGTDGGDKEGIR